jgi:dihydropteroate synthase/2-amino-4-hydroxy-6-hydroxymethyldihydropteridine diphosphokinase
MLRRALHGHRQALHGRRRAAASTQAFVALGSNQGDRVAMMRAAHAALSDLGTIEDCSYLYETLPQYVEDQPRFLNAVCRLRTEIPPHSLLRALKDIEKRFGREHVSVAGRFGPRCLDLDLLIYGDAVGTFTPEPELELPHPRIAEREFVCRPLHDVAAQLVHPTLGVTIDELLKRQAGEPSPRVFPASASHMWNFDGGPTRVMGILNVTPDSFSDGGAHNASIESAVAQAELMASEGADVIDIGGESTRPGAAAVSIEQEIERVVPVIAALRRVRAESLVISVDTRNATVAEAALDAGADIVNDVSGGLSDAAMIPLIARKRCPAILMHMRGDPSTMASLANYDDVVTEVGDELNDRVLAATKAGIPRWDVMLDPGIGFAKTFEHNLALLNNLRDLEARVANAPMLVGASRKAFIGAICNQQEPTQRDWGTTATCCSAIAGGAAMVRVHNVAAMRQVVDVMDAIRMA